MKLQKCRWDRKISGVCGGIGRSLRVDPTVVRLVVIFFAVLTAFLPFVLAYALFAILLPKGPVAYVEMRCKKLYKSRANRVVAGICGGIGDMTGSDVNVVRIIALVLLCLTMFVPLIITYIAGMFIIPEKPS